MKKFLFFLLIASLPLSQAYAQTASISGIINNYAAVTDIDFCTNTVTVDDATPFSVGDTVLIIQMQGAVIGTGNNSNYGDITDYNGSGDYEKLVISNITGNDIQFAYIILRFYDVGGSVQLVSIPQYNDVDVIGTLTAKDWDGMSGGILIFEASGSVVLHANIDLTGTGFRGSPGFDDDACWLGGLTGYTGYRCDTATSCGGTKGEGIANFSANVLGRGPQANGGGGGNDHNTGGGGGGNFGSGGDGGMRLNTNVCLGPYPGMGGKGLLYSLVDNQIFMGGGGGAGDENNSEGTDGKDGGGIAILRCNAFDANGFSINSNGLSQTLEAGSDGAGAGGAGGTIIIDASNFPSVLSLNVNGGNGGNVTDDYDFNYCMGPGGGGGGGLVWLGTVNSPIGSIINVDGGSPGMTDNYNAPGLCFNSNQGALPGGEGDTLLGHAMFFSNQPFVPLVAYAGNDTTICGGITVTLTAFGGTTYLWSPAAGVSCANCQNTDASPTITTTYTVQIFEGNCFITDSITVHVLPDPPADAGNNVQICLGDSVQLNGSGGGVGATFLWAPLSSLSCATCQNPIAFPTITTTYTFNVSVPAGCVGTDYVTVAVGNPLADAGPNQLICDSTAVNLFATGGITYSWSPSTGLSCANCQNPSALPSSTTTYTVTVTDAGGCSNIDSVTVTVGSYPVVDIQGDTVICSGQSAQIFASGGVTYSWAPNSGLSCVNCSNPFASPGGNTTYTVAADDGNGCITAQTISFIVNPLPLVDAGPDTTINSGVTITLDGTGTGSVQWNPNQSLSNDTILNPQASPTETIIYELTITDQNGCSASDTVLITVLGADQDVFVPNSFTPNGDGINDLFTIYGINGIQLEEFSIYNRWGERIFTTNDFNKGWDGKYNNLPQNTGTFVYVVRAKKTDGSSITKKGNLTLIR